MKRNIILLATTILLTMCQFNPFQYVPPPCTDDLTDYYHKVQYKNGQIISFINDSAKIKSDTVHFTYEPVKRYFPYMSDGSDGDGYCYGEIDVKLGNYEFFCHQGIIPYMESSDINIYLSYTFLKDSLLGKTFKQEIVNYKYNKSSIQSLHFLNIDTAAYHKTRYLMECYISSSSYTLLSYSIIENGVRTNWRMK